MFVGHYAVGFALKRLEPKLNLGLLVLAAAWLDVLFAVLVLLDIEHMRIDLSRPGFLAFDIYDMPYSHSLVAAAGWTLLAFVLFRFLPGRGGAGRSRPALVLAAAVASHFVLDLLTHVSDLPLMMGSTVMLGLGLWLNVPVSAGLELAVLLAGSLLYVSSYPTRPRLLLSGVAGLTIFQASYLIGCFYGLLPATPEEFGWRMVIEQSAFFALLAWFDRTASLRSSSR